MNTIIVTAVGSPNSFVRRVQHEPGIAVELLHQLKAVLDTHRDWQKFLQEKAKAMRLIKLCESAHSHTTSSAESVG